MSGTAPGSPRLRQVSGVNTPLPALMPHEAGMMPRSRTRPSRIMPRRAGPKTRRSLRTTFPHQKRKEVKAEAVIALLRKVPGRSGGGVYSVP